MPKYISILIAAMISVGSLPIHRVALRQMFVQGFTCPLPLRRTRRGTTIISSELLYTSTKRFNSDSSNVSLTRTGVRKMKVVDLRKELDLRGLDTQGLRKDLLDRLLEALPVNNPSPLTNPTLNPKGSHASSFEELQQKSVQKSKLCISPETLYVLRFHGQHHHISATSSCGLILYDSETEKEVWAGSRFYSTGESAQLAEVKALHATLPALSNVGVQKLIVQGHAGGTTIQQLQGNFGIKSKSAKEIITRIQGAMDEFEDCEVWGIAMDQMAKPRTVAKKALEKRRSEGFDLLKVDEAENDSEEEQATDISGKDISNDDDDQYDYLEAIHHDTTEQPNDEAATEQHQILVSLPSFSPDKTYVLRFDGGSRGNPGIAGAGMVLFDSESGLEVWAAFQYLGDTTNNVAEYSALLSGIEFARSMGIKRIIAEGDSTLVVKQVKGEYKVKSDHLRVLCNKVRAVAKSFDSFSIGYIPRADNFRADQLANVAMDEEATMGLEVLEYLDEQQGGSSSASFQKHAEGRELHGTLGVIDSFETSTPSADSIPESRGLKKCSLIMNIPEAEVSVNQVSTHRTYVLRIGGGMKGGNHLGMGSAAVLMDDLSDEELWSGAYFCGDEDGSQFIAGYIGLIIGLRKALSMGVTRLIVQANLKFVIHQMNGTWKVKSEAIKPYHAHAKDFCENYFEDVDFELIGDKEMTKVKALCNEVIKFRQSRLPGFSGYEPKIK